ncbi:MAG: SpoIID/LytB domain-containing protein [Patescibacteria group bacterium]|jgi:peptidoglycan hydrolase-like amidase
MTALNYHVSPGKRQALLAVILTILVALLSSTSFAEGKCASIDNLDDKAACYAEKEATKRKEKDELTSELSELLQDIKGLSSNLSLTQQDISRVEGEITQISEKLDSINDALDERRDQLEENYALRNKAIRQYSKKSRYSDLEMFLKISSVDEEASGFQQAAINFMIDKRLNDKMLDLIANLNVEITSYEKEKKETEEFKAELESARASLVSLKNQLAEQQRLAEQEKKDKEGDIADLEKEIAELSAKQQAILAAKGGEFSASLGTSVETDDPRTSINYKPDFSPAFAAFSYGAYTHRNGMSQYGAKGRAEDGQSYEDILKFYYKVGVGDKGGLDDKDICVEGKGSMEMGEYLKGLGEMPPSWNEEALKAQAVAARTYAYRYTKNGGCICTDTRCQYFSSDLVNKSGRDRWYEAIKNTKNEILDGDVSAQYSSTTGGWINGIGWDKDGGSWPKDAYEKKGGSPWFYKAWFTQTYRRESSTCGRDHPWLDGEEMADILNAYVLLKAGKNTERVIPETINKCPLSGVSGDPYSKDELREKAESVNKGYSEVTNVSNVSASDGKTNSLTFSTDQGSITVDGQLFMKAFNIRAPGYIAIKYSPDSKALFDVVKK